MSCKAYLWAWNTILGVAVALSGIVHAATIEVNSTADSGAGSLRNALSQANGAAGEDTISITLTAGAIIQVDGDLPTITAPVNIIAQSPYITLQASQGSTATRGLQAGAGSASIVTISGLEIAAFPIGVILSGEAYLYNCIVRDSGGDGIQVANATKGLIGRESDVLPGCFIHGNGGNGIRLGGGGELPTLSVEYSRIGVDETGTLDGNGGAGISVQGTNQIQERYIYQNLISGNAGPGIRLTSASASGLIIGGNTIGVEPNQNPAPNGGGGIVVNASSGVLIGAAGGDTFGRQPNTIISNTNYGVLLNDASSTCSVSRNIITANAGRGVEISNGASSNVIIGNTFTLNLGEAIGVTSGDCAANTFNLNQYRQNGGLVVLVSGANGGIQPPVLNTLYDRVGTLGLPPQQSVEWYGEQADGMLVPLGTGVDHQFVEELSGFFGANLRAAATDQNKATSAFSESIVVTPPTSVTEGDCANGIAYDDDTPSDALSLPADAALGGFLMRFAPAVPFHIQQVCLNLQSFGAGPFMGAVALYRDNGGAPGTLIRRVPFGVVLTDTMTHYVVDLSAPRTSVDSGAVFIGLLYDQSAYPDAALAADAGAGVTPQPVFRSVDGGSSWDSFGSIPLALDVIGVRLVGEETGCSDGIIVDDGTFENSFGPSGIVSGFAVIETPETYPFTYSGTCLRLKVASTRVPFIATLNAFAYEQGQIGALLKTIPLDTILIDSAESWYHFDFGQNKVTVAGGSVFFRLDWTASVPAGNNEALLIDTTPATQLQNAYARQASDGQFFAMNLVLPAFRSFGWRFDGAVPGEGEGVAEGIVEGIVDGAQEGILEGVVEGIAEGAIEGINEGVVEGTPEGTPEGINPAPQSADVDGDFVIELSEVLRVVQLYNADSFGCQGSTEDGFAPNDPDHNCPPHSTDYINQDWHISLSELLRLIQLYSLGGYVSCNTSDDGFCPLV